MLAKNKAGRQKPHRELSPDIVYDLIKSIALIIILVGFGLFLAWRPIQMVRLRRDIAQLERLKAEMIEINTRFRVEKATLTCLDRVEKKARKELGFIEPDNKQLIDVFVNTPPVSN